MRTRTVSPDSFAALSRKPVASLSYSVPNFLPPKSHLKGMYAVMHRTIISIAV
ncbi:MAG: hypothetical protein JWN52_3538 [Actinomycetia bacterium]|jgi:hypothetical protein|nr:hypothetical protein [Actinomycetes bacterium]